MLPVYQGQSLVGLKMFHGYLRCYHWQKLADDTQELSVLFSQILVNLKLFKDKKFFFFFKGNGVQRHVCSSMVSKSKTWKQRK